MAQLAQARERDGAARGRDRLRLQGAHHTSMTTYLLRRLGYAVLILIGVNLLTFILFFTVNTPDDMARLNIGGKRVTQEQIDKWKAERGYDRPLYWNAAGSGTDKLTHTVLWGSWPLPAGAPGCSSARRGRGRRSWAGGSSPGPRRGASRRA